ncbi:hypothetical protein BOTBODRAFT_30646 [Botryobasidium botryosum FD-172 SS1]|uniref:Transmembrane protein n=1 Tax=Botryobasidium botryosum (strain FD-172 SS1) TaxID=930990 RepID=A0A067MPU6_BOTB1|nr:hypothetical protein BOTBODRAFT_30646 [Botryobasidium botryosum FD-172 SS1]
MHPRTTILAAATLASQFLVARAQLTASTNATCSPAFSWTTNSKGQNPCLVVAYLSAQCANIPWIVNALPPASAQPYNVPMAPYANDCRCSSVAYDLLSACGLCQGGPVTTWADWTSNCSANVISVGKYPRSTPSETEIPGWAFWDPTTNGGTFNATAAQLFGQGSSGGSKSHAGAIAGGIVGGLAGLALIGGLIWWFMRRRRNANNNDAPASQIPYQQVAHNNLAQPQYGGAPQQATPYSLNPTPMKPYDPNDPSTFPSSAAGGYTNSPTPGYPPSAQHYQQPYPQPYQPGAPHSNTPGYSGVAEL